MRLKHPLSGILADLAFHLTFSIDFFSIFTSFCNVCLCINKFYNNHNLKIILVYWPDILDLSIFLYWTLGYLSLVCPAKYITNAIHYVYNLVNKIYCISKRSYSNNNLFKNLWSFSLSSSWLRPNHLCTKYILFLSHIWIILFKILGRLITWVLFMVFVGVTHV